MSEAKLYYTPPSQELFQEMKMLATLLWCQYDEPDYRNEKIGKIANIENIEDNFMYMFAMFDWVNQPKLLKIASRELREAVRARLIDGGTDDWYLENIGLKPRKE